MCDKHLKECKYKALEKFNVVEKNHDEQNVKHCGMNSSVYYVIYLSTVWFIYSNTVEPQLWNNSFLK